MTYELVEEIVASTMNILEHEYGIEELTDFGMPTVIEIAQKIVGEN